MTERNGGLADLKRILTHNRRSPAIEALKEKHYIPIFEGLFRVAAEEKAISLKSNRAGTSSRLSSCAEVLRQYVEAGVRTLREDTVLTLLSHVVHTLPVKAGQLFAPLSVDYLKCLRAIFEYQPHIEHLLPKDWETAVDFCLESLSEVSLRKDRGKGFDGDDASHPRSAPTSFLSKSGSNFRDSGNSGPWILSTLEIEELVLCLRDLVRPTNAPVHSRADEILAALMDVLRSPRQITKIHPDAFAALNLVLSRVSSDNIEISHNALRQMMPLIKSLWSPKALAANDEMLRTLIGNTRHIRSMLERDVDESFADDIRSLLDVLHHDYSQRTDRGDKNQLQLDDVELLGPDVSCFHSSLENGSLVLRIGNPKVENRWFLVHQMAILSHLLDARSERARNVNHDNDSQDRSKRRRTESLFSTYSRECSLGNANTRTGNLQLLAFSFPLRTLDKQEFEDVVNRLTGCASDDDATVSSWAMLAMAW